MANIRQFPANSDNPPIAALFYMAGEHLDRIKAEESVCSLSYNIAIDFNKAGLPLIKGIFSPYVS